MFGLYVANDGFNGTAPLEFALDLSVDTSFLTSAEDPQGFGSIVPNIALVRIDTLRLLGMKGIEFGVGVSSDGAASRLLTALGQRLL